MRYEISRKKGDGETARGKDWRKNKEGEDHETSRRDRSPRKEKSSRRGDWKKEENVDRKGWTSSRGNDWEKRRM